MLSQAGQVLRLDLSPRNPPSINQPGFSDNGNGRSGFAGNGNRPPAPPFIDTSNTASITASPTTTSTTTQVLATSTSPTSPSETSVSPNAPPPSSTSSTESTSLSTTSAQAVTTTSTQQPAPTPSPTQSYIDSTSMTLTPSVYSQISPVLPTQSFVGTTLQTSFTRTTSTTALPTGIVPATGTPIIVTEPSHGTLAPGQKAGIAVGVIAGLVFVVSLIWLLFRWRKGRFLKALPRLGSRGKNPWLSRSRPDAEMSDSFLTPGAGIRGSLGWDYRSTFAQPTPKEKLRRSLSRSLRRLVRFNPLAEHPITPNGTGEETPSRNSFASFFRRRSTASTAQTMVDVESPPALPPLPPGFLVQPPATASSDRSTNFERNDTDNFLRPPTIPSEVLPPAFHRSWCYRNSQTTMASEDSETRSFKSVPGWVKFHYPGRLRNYAEGSHHSWRTLPAPQALSPGSWLRAKFLRRSQSPTASAEKGGSHLGTSTNNFGDESANTVSPMLGKGEGKQNQETYRMSSESVDSLMMEKQHARQI
ncbi:hypothetical protein NA56DRAFT_482531 [Hyaloscypha hepaticicola]|uniref:Uncharacterized protein n=1 Tax=Hyaloscypha hepaticicola TaxID=2082293 RepID=A0A2J6PEU9_9HELO|nr:hypothetical protein NA56DRAFT_482531 [Hyaloscypha hepaticicola]